MFSSLLITLREGLEAALIIAIIVAFLIKTENRQYLKHIWTGVSLAIVVSLAVGAGIFLLAGEFSGQTEEIFEGIAMFAAAGVLTWMIFWMRKQAINIKGHLHSQMRSVITGDSSLGLILLAFIAVVREGIETVFFLFASTRVDESALLSTIGGILGLAIAIGIGYTIYKGSSRLNLRMFFNITSILLIFLAAGLVAHGVHEFNEAGVIPSMVEHVWDINHILPENSTVGQFLTALVGYNGNPSLTEVLSYSLFLITALGFYFKPLIKTRISSAVKVNQF